MTGLSRSSADLSPRRRRILYRCWHRGIREMDLVFGQFAEDEISRLSDSELDEFEAIMGEDDHDLHAWITGGKPLPDHLQTELFARISAYRPDFGPVTTASLKAKAEQSE
ncbi:FAD assembly factor SdhE [Rhizobium halophilum]|uniref:FAD assembly factor SdhE n=1 Tax=Rhizobium halophilum TaxID=2846852 RepID=UPI001EFCBBFD|nr:succinate dehydrogenase assembly factor 2 [Rhizobium halophilum]MCF6368534.1 succinate dehydrogenase assembly factor 2 [Rhizobium halophilum]